MSFDDVTGQCFGLRDQCAGTNMCQSDFGSDCDGEITYDLEEFCEDYGDPAGQLFTFEVTFAAITYVYAGVAATVRMGEVVFELSRDKLVCTRKAH
jgi:hypothetical protein